MFSLLVVCWEKQKVAQHFKLFLAFYLQLFSVRKSCLLPKSHQVVLVEREAKTVQEVPDYIQIFSCLLQFWQQIDVSSLLVVEWRARVRGSAAALRGRGTVQKPDRQQAGPRPNVHGPRPLSSRTQEWYACHTPYFTVRPKRKRNKSSFACCNTSHAEGMCGKRRHRIRFEQNQTPPTFFVFGESLQGWSWICHEQHALKMEHKNHSSLLNLFFSGMYWVDPNQGSPVDAIEVHCDLTTHTTCILPKPSQVWGHQRILENILILKTSIRQVLLAMNVKRQWMLHWDDIVSGSTLFAEVGYVILSAAQLRLSLFWGRKSFLQFAFGCCTGIQSHVVSGPK